VLQQGLERFQLQPHLSVPIQDNIWAGVLVATRDRFFRFITWCRGEGFTPVFSHTPVEGTDQFIYITLVRSA